MKRIISFLLTVLLLVSTSAAAVSADVTPITGSDEPTFIVSSEQSNPGKAVSVTIRMEHNPGIASIKLRVQFDSDLTLNGIAYNTALGGMSQQPQTLTSPVTLNWFNGAANTEGDMAIAVLDFTVAETASIGEHAISITYDEEDVYRIDGAQHETDVTFGVVNGGVNVVIPVTGLSLDRASATVSTGDGTFTLTPVFDPENATNKNVSWDSSDKTVATVDGGVVTLLKKGETVITATSEDGGYEAACVLTVLCSHLHSEEIPADPSTCIHHGHGAYTVCTDCGEIVSGSDAPLPYAEHQFVADPKPEYLKSAATCASLAVYCKSCSVCGEQGTQTFTYGEKDPENHVGGTHIENQAAASCKQEGYTGDVVCDSCHEVLAYGESTGYGDHTPAGQVVENETPASCLEGGSYEEAVYCSVCGDELSRNRVEVPALGHTYGDPVWTWDGYESAVAVISCIRGDDEHRLTAVITSEVTQEPSASGDGERTYTAAVTFNGKTYTDVKTEVIARKTLIGDSDCDGQITILDATYIQRRLANLPVDLFDETAADTDGDGNLTILDATVIQRYLVNLPSSDYIGKYLS